MQHAASMRPQGKGIAEIATLGLALDYDRILPWRRTSDARVKPAIPPPTMRMRIRTGRSFLGSRA